jgi:hypothetical protein
VRFDDRLATVLAQPVATAHDRAVRWRQLVDLVARSGGEGDRDLLDRALDLIRRDARSIREPLRAATARAIAGQPVPVALLALFAADKLAVAAPLIAPALLEGETLEAIRAAASPDVRRFLDNLHPPPAAPSVPIEESGIGRSMADDAQPASQADAVPSISDVLARIEKIRAERAPAARPVPSAPTRTPVEPVAARVDPPSAFRWECNPGGEIEWVEGAPRGPLVGRSIAAADADEGVDECVERAFTIRAPFRDCILEMGDSGAVAGTWTISGAPAFGPGDGRFIGYRGIARKGLPDADSPVVVDQSPEGHDALREMIHEIKTPLNAIIGFAEIIDGQYFGPAHRRYRERAAEIVTNARSLLTAAEDLDFVARMQSPKGGSGTGTDFASFFPGFAVNLLERAAKLGVSIDLDAPDQGGQCTLEPELTERLLFRFTEALLSAAEPGERLVCHVHRFDVRCAMSFTRPRATILATKDDLMDPEFTIGDADRDLLGLGFSMRLVNGLASLAGGGLEISDEYFTLFVPLKHD